MRSPKVLVWIFQGLKEWNTISNSYIQRNISYSKPAICFKVFTSVCCTLTGSLIENFYIYCGFIMKKYLSICIAMLLTIVSARSQSLDMFGIDASAFPTVKAKFFATDASNQRINNLNPADFAITEGWKARSVLNVTCPSAAAVPISSLLIMDVSGSMEWDLGGFKNLDMAKGAATAWINGLPQSTCECAITSFNGSSYIDRDFTSDKASLLAAINAMAGEDGTNYEPAFLDQLTGGFKILNKAKYKKVIIFLSDGQPNFEPDIPAIIAQAQAQNAFVYCVTLNMPCPKILRDLSEQTGAEWFENVTTIDEAKEVYKRIQFIAQGIEPCTIEWQSGLNCSFSRNDGEARLVANGASDKFSYVPPENSVAYLDIVPSGVFFRNKKPGVGHDTTLTVTAVNSAFTVSGFATSDNHFTISPSSFSLNQGESRSITLTYTPTDSSIIYTKIDLITDLCPASIYARGGFLGHKIETPTLRVVSPNGGESYVVATDSIITWEGILPQDVVGIEYSTDGGSTWSLLTDSASGMKWNWKNIPKPPSGHCLVRVQEQVSPTLISEFNADFHYNSKIFPLQMNETKWSPDGTRLASISRFSDESPLIISAWNASTGDSIHYYYYDGPNPFDISSLSWSPDGTRLATGRGNGEVDIWNVQTGERLFVLGETSRQNLWHDPRFNVEWNMDGNKIAHVTNNGLVQVWDGNTGTLLRKLDPANEATRPLIMHIAWSPIDDRLAIADCDSTAKIFDANTGSILHTLSHPSWVQQVAWNPDGSTLVTTSEDGTAKIWNTSNGLMLKSINVESLSSYYYKTIVWNPNGSSFAIIREEGVFENDMPTKIFDAKSGKELMNLIARGIGTFGVVKINNVFSWHHSGLFFAIADNKSTKVYDANTYSLISIVPGVDPVWSPVENRLVTMDSLTDTTNIARVWDVPLIAPNGVPGIQWKKTFGGSGEDYLESIAKCADGSYIVAGSTDSQDGDVLVKRGKSDFWVMRLSPTDGGRIWQQWLGGSGNDIARSIIECDDGSIVVAGESDSKDGQITSSWGKTDCWVVKLDADGGMIWQKNLGGSGDDAVYSITEGKDNSYIVSGWTNSTDGNVSGNKGGIDYWVAKLNATNGDIIWSKCLGGTGSDYAYSVMESKDGYYVVAGSSASADGDVLANKGGYDYWIAKLDPADGRIVWKKSYGGSGNETANSIIESNDGNYIVSGYSASSDGDVTGNHGQNDYWILKVQSTDGALIWEKTLGGSDRDNATSIVEESDGTLCVAGYSYSVDGDVTGNHGLSDWWIAKLKSADGSMVWQKTIGGSGGNECAMSIIKNDDASFAIAGFATSNDGDFSNNRGGRDFWIAKLEPPVQLQSDVSDNVFAIIMPTLVSKDINMGKVYVSTFKDSTVSAFITNTGTSKTRIDSISFTAAGTNPFSITSGNAPFELKPGGTRAVEFRFHPAALGVQTATINIYSPDSTLKQTITGDGVSREIEVISSTIDFGQVELGDFRDTANAFTIRNVSPNPVTITSIAHEGPNASDFTTVQTIPSMTIPAGDTAKMTLKFLPSGLGRTTGTLHFNYIGTNSPAIVRLYGEGINSLQPAGTATISAGSVSVASGVTASVPIVLQAASDLGIAGVTAFSFELLYDASVAEPVAMTSYPETGNLRYLRFDNIATNGAAGEVLANVSFRAIGAPGTLTVLTVRNVLPIGGAAAITLVNGLINIVDQPGCSATLRADTATAFVGDTVRIPIILSQQNYLSASGVTGFTFDLSYNSTILKALDFPNEVENNGTKTITLTSVSTTGTAGETLTNVRFVVALGNAEFTSLVLSNYSSVGAVATIGVEDGRVSIADICKEGGPRFVNGSLHSAMRSVTPNPAGETITIEYSNADEGKAEFNLTDVLGNTVKSARLEKVQNGVLTIDLSDVPQGLYFGTFKTESVVSSVRIGVIK